MICTRVGIITAFVHYNNRLQTYHHGHRKHRKIRLVRGLNLDQLYGHPPYLRWILPN